MSSDKSSQQSISSASTKEEVLRRIKKGDMEIPAEAPLLPRYNLKVQKYLRRSLDNPDDYELSKLNKSEGMTTGVRNAVRNNNLSLQNYFTGRQDWDSDISGIQSLKTLFNIISSPGGRLIYLFGPQGSGKTDFAILKAEFLNEIKGVEVATNIKSLAENVEQVEYIHKYKDMNEWLRTDGRKYYILDEASSLLTGYYSDSGDVIDAFKDFITKLRKNNSNICLIGHSGKDIHPLFRRLAVFMHKKSKKKVEMYRTASTTDNGEVRGHDKLVELNKIPATNWSYRTDEESTFYINTDGEAQKYTEEELQEMIDERLDKEIREYRNSLMRQVYQHTDASFSDISEMFQLSEGQVSNVLS